MKIFVVKYTHPNEAGWLDALEPHIDYLESLAADGRLLASGPIIDAKVKSAILILNLPDEAQLHCQMTAKWRKYWLRSKTVSIL